jgi:hypothetical protein
VKNYYRICAQWRFLHNQRAGCFIEETAHKYGLMKGLPSAIRLEKQRVLERERKQKEVERLKKRLKREDQKLERGKRRKRERKRRKKGEKI